MVVTTPHSSTGETSFRLTYGSDAMIPVELGEPSFRRENVDETVNPTNLAIDLDLLVELRDVAHLREYAVKQRAARRYDSKVIPRELKQGDLVLKKITGADAGGKLSPNWEGPYKILEKLSAGAYRLETIAGTPIPRTWNSTNLRYYFS